MERFTARKAQAGSSEPRRTVQHNPVNTNETFSEMANVTAARSGVIGKLLVVSLIVVSVAITAFVGYAIVNGVGGNNQIKSDQYQAVFLTDGQIYFGKLASLDDDYVVLEDIYYLQVQQEVQPDTSETPQSQISLAKLGNELHGPEDKMFINASQILFWENLKVEGQVTQAIENYVNGVQPSNNSQQQSEQQNDNADAGTDEANDSAN